MEIKVEININMYIKKLLFKDEYTAGRFHQYIEFIIESGKHIRKSFHLIDTRRTMRIYNDDLRKALVRVDLDINEEDINKMYFVNIIRFTVIIIVVIRFPLFLY